MTSYLQYTSLRYQDETLNSYIILDRKIEEKTKSPPLRQNKTTKNDENLKMLNTR
jgi:hypothetical protein